MRRYWHDFQRLKYGENEITATDRGRIEPTHLEGVKVSKATKSPKRQLHKANLATINEAESIRAEVQLST
jgi:hypothetical protein